MLTENKSFTQFFQSKTIPPALWNFLDGVLSFSLVIKHIPGGANYAADFLSRMQTDWSAIISLEMSDKIPIKELHIDMSAQFPDATLKSVDPEGAFIDSTDRRLIEQFKARGLYNQYV